jgi:hypothetical protein
MSCAANTGLVIFTLATTAAVASSQALRDKKPGMWNLPAINPPVIVKKNVKKKVEESA